jgi:hypothetical protein
MSDLAAADRRDLVKSTPTGRALADVVQRQGRPVVVVLGMQYSGMSLAAHILSLLGIDMADPIDPQSAGPDRRWECLELADTMTASSIFSIAATARRIRISNCRSRGGQIRGFAKFNARSRPSSNKACRGEPRSGSWIREPLVCCRFGIKSSGSWI